MPQYLPTKHTNLRRRPTSGEYVLFAQVGGKLYREGLKTHNEELALLRRDERIAEIRRTLFAQRDQFDDRLALRDFVAVRLDQIETAVERLQTELALIKSTFRKIPGSEMNGVMDSD